jgi:putative copper export protein
MAACLLVFGTDGFELLIVRSFTGQHSAARALWRPISRGLLILSLPVALASGAVWFVLVTMDMTGAGLSEAIQFDNLKSVWNETHFGQLWRVRLIIWVVSAAAASVVQLSRKRSLARLGASFVAGSLLVLSLAWAGHGQDTGTLHVLADGVHLLVSGLWPIGLVPFALLLRSLRRSQLPEKWISLSAIVHRFSAMSLICAMLITLTGVTNAWFLLGRYSNLFHTTYGRLLLVKLVTFLFLIAIGAFNLLYLKPRANADSAAEGVGDRLQMTVGAELVLTALILPIVGILGLLAPGGG